VRSTKRGAVGAPAGEAGKKDPRTVKTDAGTLRTLVGFGPEGATLAQWERAVGRANDTFYKSRSRLIEAGMVRHDAENARYIVTDPSGSPGPALVQNGSNLNGVQKVSPVVPP
jgi:hypothetical protein